MKKNRNLKLKKYSSWLLIVTILVISFIILKTVFNFKGYTLDYILLGLFFILSVILNKKYRNTFIKSIKKILNI